MSNNMKLLLSLGMVGLLSGAVLAGNPYAGLNPVSPANENFTLIQQYGFDREQTLDYANDPDAYKEKREEQSNPANFMNNVDALPPSTQSFSSDGYARPGSNNMHFVKDENGKLRIQGF